MKNFFKELEILDRYDIIISGEKSEMILSVSRRTDVPAFYADWFFERLKEGFVLVPNPINPAKVARVALEPLKFEVGSQNLLGEAEIKTTGTLEGIVFWTKNPEPMIARLGELGDINFYFLYTITGYSKEIEANLPPLDERIESFKTLAKICPVIWRYDPILMSKDIDVSWHIQNFMKLCEALSGCTTHCKISFLISSYNGCAKSVYAPNFVQKHEILAAFSKIAKLHNIQIEACAESGDYSLYGISPSKCIDGEIFEQLLTEKFANKNIVVKRNNSKLDGQRKHCGCMPAVDMGQYDTCRHGCNYCYARKGTLKNLAIPPKGEIYDRKLNLEFDYLPKR